MHTTYISIGTYIHAYLRTYIHTFRTCVLMYICTCKTYVSLYIHTYIHKYIRGYMCMYIHTYIHTASMYAVVHSTCKYPILSADRPLQCWDCPENYGRILLVHSSCKSTYTPFLRSQAVVIAITVVNGALPPLSTVSVVSMSWW